MKSLVKFFILAWCFCLLEACNESKQEGGKPAPIVDYTVTPIHGGAVITYDIPKDKDILYVMAEYLRNGKTFTERSSVFKNTISVQGFNTSDPVSVTLYSVNEKETKSDPLHLDFVPLESPVSLTHKSVNIIPTFGGILVSWENISKTEMGVRLMVDSLGLMIEKDMYFSSLSS